MSLTPHGLFVDASLFAVAFAAGAINSVAGGGTLLTFPTLIFAGVSPIVANATNTLALVPGSASAMWGYRSFLKTSQRELLLLAVPSVIGGVLGAEWVIHTGNAKFAALIPWLIFAATALFVIQEPLSRMLKRSHPSDGSDDVPQDPLHRIGTAIFQFFVAIYGGFFGAGIGIMMLAALGFMGFARNIHRANGIKNCAAVCINGVAAITFIYERQVNWPFAALMALGAIAGGYGGAGVARKLGQKTVRNLIVAIGVAIGIIMLIHRP